MKYFLIFILIFISIMSYAETNILKDIKNNSVVELQKGDYIIENTIKLENLYNVTIKGNKTTLKGGIEVKNFQRVSDKYLLDKLPKKVRNKVFVADISNIIIPPFQRRGFSFKIPENTLWVYANNKPLKETHYPKDGFLYVDKVIQGGTKEGEPSIFEYNDNKFDTWAEEKNIELFGYFKYLWADASIIAKVDATNKTLILDPPYFYVDKPLDNEQGIQYYAKNLFSELGPDTYYIDRENKLLYVYFNSGIKDKKIEISSLNSPMIEMKNCSNIKFENIIFDMGQNRTFYIENSKDITLNKLNIKKFSHNGIEVNNCENVTISNCEIFNMGRCGIYLTGGDYDNLIPCNYLVENNNIHHFGIIDHTYVPAVRFDGVGLKVCHNEFHHCPTSVFTLAGSEILFEYNYVHDACLESDDQGTIDIFGNSSFRGNVYRYNRFENNGFVGRKQISGVAGIRFDDTICGQYVYGNIFKNTAKGCFGCININSGRDNKIENNIFIDSEAVFSGGFSATNWIWTHRVSDRGVNYTPLFLQRYPEMKNVFDENGNVRLDGTNYYKNNIIVNCDSITPKPSRGGWVNWKEPTKDSMENNIVLDRKYIDKDYKIKKEIDFEFKEIPYSEIGIIKN